jgi:hypothetical protein
VTVAAAMLIRPDQLSLFLDADTLSMRREIADIGPFGQCPGDDNERMTKGAFF